MSGTPVKEIAEPPHQAILKQAPSKEEKGPGDALAEKTTVHVVFNLLTKESFERMQDELKDADWFCTLDVRLDCKERDELIDALKAKGAVRILHDPYISMEFAGNGFEERCNIHDKAVTAVRKYEAKASHSFSEAVEAAKERARLQSQFYQTKEAYRFERVCQKIRDTIRLDELRAQDKLSKTDAQSLNNILLGFRIAAGMRSFTKRVTVNKTASYLEVMNEDKEEFLGGLGVLKGELEKQGGAAAKEKKAEIERIAKTGSTRITACMNSFENGGGKKGGKKGSSIQVYFSRVALVVGFYTDLARAEMEVYGLLKRAEGGEGLNSAGKEWVAQFEKAVDSQRMAGKIVMESVPYCPKVCENFKSEVNDLGVADTTFEYPVSKGEKEPILPLEFQLAQFYAMKGGDKGREELLATQVALKCKAFPYEKSVPEEGATKAIGYLTREECEKFFTADLGERLSDAVWFYHQCMDNYFAIHPERRREEAFAEYLESELDFSKMGRRIGPAELPADAVLVKAELFSDFTNVWMVKTGRKVLECMAYDKDAHITSWEYYLDKKDYEALVAYLKTELKLSDGDAVPKALVLALKGENNAELVGRLKLIRELGFDFNESYLSMTKEEFEKMSLEEQRKRERKADFADWFSVSCDDPALAYLRKFIFTEMPQSGEERETDKIAIRILQSFGGSWESKKPAGKFREQLEATLSANPEKERIAVAAHRKAKLLSSLHNISEKIEEYKDDEYYDPDFEIKECAGKYGDVLLRAANSEEGVLFRVLAGEITEPAVAALWKKMPFEWEAALLSGMGKADFNAAKQEKIALMKDSHVDEQADRKLIERITEGNLIEAKPKVVLVEVPAPAKEVTAALTPQAESARLRMALNLKLAQCEAMKLLRPGEKEAFHAPSLKPLYTFYREKDIRALKKELLGDDAVRIKLLGMRMSAPREETQQT